MSILLYETGQLLTHLKKRENDQRQRNNMLAKLLEISQNQFLTILQFEQTDRSSRHQAKKEKTKLEEKIEEMNKEIMTLKLENFEKTLIIEKIEKVGQEDYKRMDKMEDIVHEQFLKKEEDHRLFDLERKSLQSQIEYLKTICHRYAMGEFMLKKESTEKDFKKESPISLYTSVADAVSHRNK